MYFVYIIQSQKKGNFYIGSTSNVAIRIQRHNDGWTKSSKSRGPWVLRYVEGFASKSEALKREKYLKNLKSHKILERIIAANTAEVVPINREVSSSPPVRK